MLPRFRVNAERLKTRPWARLVSRRTWVGSHGMRGGTRPTRILSERRLPVGRLPIVCPLSRRLASWILVVDFERSGFNWQVDP